MTSGPVSFAEPLLPNSSRLCLLSAVSAFDEKHMSWSTFLVLDGGEQKSGDGNSRSMGLGCNTIPAKPQQLVEETYGLARTAGFAGIAKLNFLHELSAQLTCSGRMERQLHRAR